MGGSIRPALFLDKPDAALHSRARPRVPAFRSGFRDIVRQIGTNFVRGGPLPERGHHARQGIRKTSGEINFSLSVWPERQLLHGWTETGGDAGFFAARINPVPPVMLEINGNQPMQKVGGLGIIKGQTLVAKRRRYPSRAKQRHQQVAFRVTETRAMPQDIGCNAGDDGNAMIGAVAYEVANPEKTPACGFFVACRITRDLRSRSNDGGVVAVDNRCRLKKLFHGPRVLGVCGGDEYENYSLPNHNAKGRASGAGVHPNWRTVCRESESDELGDVRPGCVGPRWVMHRGPATLRG